MSGTATAHSFMKVRSRKKRSKRTSQQIVKACQTCCPGYNPFEDCGTCFFSVDEARRYLDCFENCIHHVKGEHAGEPIICEDWQVGVLANIFGWRRPTEPGLALYDAIFEDGDTPTDDEKKRLTYRLVQLKRHCVKTKTKYDPEAPIYVGMVPTETNPYMRPGLVEGVDLMKTFVEHAEALEYAGMKEAEYIEINEILKASRDDLSKFKNPPAPPQPQPKQYPPDQEA